MIASLYPIFQHWSEKGSVYIISDTHFDDIDRLPMGYNITNEEQLNILKSKIHKNDTLIHLGDVGNPEYIARIKGYKVLIMGNHDQSIERYAPYFNEVYSGPLMISKQILLSHEPIYGVPYIYNIHGHDHAGYNIENENHLNLASNICNYEPLNLGKFIKSGGVSKIDNIHRMTIDKATEKKALRKILDM